MVRLFFAERPGIRAGQRVQDVSLQGITVLQDFDIARSAGGTMRGVIREAHDVAVDGQLTLLLAAEGKATLISGLELIRNGLTIEPLPNAAHAASW